MSDVDDLRRKFLEEANGSRYSINPCSTKIYRDLQEIYWWDKLKRDKAEFVAKYLNCHEVKAKHQRPGGLT